MAGASGTGPGAVTVNVAANPTETVRTGTLTIAGQAVPVQVEGLGACTIDISPTSASFGKDAATGSFAVTAPGHCQWSAVSNAGWLAVTSGGQGTGNGTVSYSVERNRETASRSAAITVGGRMFAVTQSGDSPVECTYSVAPVEFEPCMSIAYQLSAAVTTQQGCSWSAGPDVSWITITGGQSGNGSGVISFRVSDNWDAPRQGIVKVRWPTPTAGQNLRVSQAGCAYAVNPDTISVAAGGGPGRFDVYQQSTPIACGGPTQNACMWIARSDVPWITVSSARQVGDNPVSFTVAANESATARTGSITVRDKVVRVNQAAR